MTEGTLTILERSLHQLRPHPQRDGLVPAAFGQERASGYCEAE